MYYSNLEGAGKYVKKEAKENDSEIGALLNQSKEISGKPLKQIEISEYKSISDKDEL